MNRTLTIILLSICFAACTNSKPKTLFAASQPVEMDTTSGECPYLTKDNKGNTVLSWVRMINDSTTALCYAISKEGKKFSNPVVIPNSSNIEPHAENIPKVIFKPTGEIIAMWGASNPNPKNKYSGTVYYTQSFDNGNTWTNPKALVSDTAGYDQRYFDLALLPNGEVAAIWLDNRKTIHKEGSALYFATTNGKNGFEHGKLIAQPCCQCCRTDLYVDSKGGIHAIFRGIVQDSIRDMVHTISTDDGKTFSDPKRISKDNWVIKGCPHTGPSMTENKNGIHFAWFTGGKNKGCLYTKTTDGGKSFAPADSISSAGAHPQITSLPNGELIIVWDEGEFTKGKMVKRIAIQKRNAEGITEGRDYITSENSNASYPVISPVNDTSFVVAYSLRKGDKDFITYQLIGIK
jgi:hypothetical protein